MAYLYSRHRDREIMTNEERTIFENAVMDIVRLIPFGRATSYGAIARAIGFPNLPRMVGRVMASLSEGHGLPTHRVVNSHGRLSAKSAFGPGREMEEMLVAEGVEVANDIIKNWRQVFWNPLSEIEILS